MDAEHPSKPGHFPGKPIVPGVVLVDKVLACAANFGGVNQTITGLKSVKFYQPLDFGVECDVEFSQQQIGQLRFQCKYADALIAEGVFSIGSI